MKTYHDEDRGVTLEDLHGEVREEDLEETYGAVRVDWARALVEAKRHELRDEYDRHYP